MQRFFRTVCGGMTMLLLGLTLFSTRAPIVGEHGFRQALTYSVATNFLHTSGDFFHPRIDWNGGGPGIMAMEAPVYPYLSYLAMYFLGEEPATARFVAWGLFAVGLLAAYRMVARAQGTGAAAAFCLVLMFSPAVLFESRQIQPDGPMLGFVLIAAYFLYRYSESERRQYYLLGLAAYALAVLTKAPAVVVAPAMWFFSFAGKPVALRRVVLRAVGIAASVGGGFAWRQWAWNLSESYNAGSSRFVTEVNWSTIARSLSDSTSLSFVIGFLTQAYATHWAFLPFVVIGSFLCADQDQLRLRLPFAAWFLGGLAMCAAFSRHAVYHWYDVLLLSPPLAYLAAQGILYVFDLGRGGKAPDLRGRWTAFFLLGCGLLTPFVGGAWETESRVVAAQGQVAGTTWLSLKGGWTLVAIGAITLGVAIVLRRVRFSAYVAVVVISSVALVARVSYEDVQIFAWRARVGEWKEFHRDWGPLRSAVDSYSTSSERIVTNGAGNPWFLHLARRPGFSDYPDEIERRSIDFYRVSGARLFVHFPSQGRLPIRGHAPLDFGTKWALYCLPGARCDPME